MNLLTFVFLILSWYAPFVNVYRGLSHFISVGSDVANEATEYGEKIFHVAHKGTQKFDCVVDKARNEALQPGECVVVSIQQVSTQQKTKKSPNK